MDKSRRTLLTYALIIIGLVVINIVEIAADFYLGGFNDAIIPEGAPENIMELTKGFLIIFSAIILLPQLYVGIKGVRVARNPDSSRGHIFWATIIFIIALLGCISAIIDWVNGVDAYECFSLLVDSAFDAIVYYEFIVVARKVRNEC